jgi:hypothetical protein
MDMLVCRCFYAGWGEGRLPNMTGGHVFVREPISKPFFRTMKSPRPFFAFQSQPPS